MTQFPSGRSASTPRGDYASHDAPWTGRHGPGLPDPDRESAFYSFVSLKRGIACLIDMALIFILAVIILPFTAFTALFFFPAFMIVVGFLYRWATLSRKSATWGMRFMALQLRENDGLRLSGSTALLHVAGFYLSLAVFPLALISAALMVLRGKGQGLTDMILGTAMINRPAAGHHL